MFLIKWHLLFQIVSITCKVDFPKQPERPSNRFNFFDDVEVNAFLPTTPAPPPVVSRFGGGFDPVPVQPIPYYPPPPVQPQDVPVSPPVSAPPPANFNSSFSFFSQNSSSFLHRDETQVVQPIAPSSCPDTQFTCKSPSRCIPIDRMCDRFSDCEDNSDETYEGCHVS